MNDTIKALTETVMSMTARVGRDAFIRQQTAIMNRPDSRPGLSRIDCPTLVLWSDAGPSPAGTSPSMSGRRGPAMSTATRSRPGTSSPRRRPTRRRAG